MMPNGNFASIWVRWMQRVSLVGRQVQLLVVVLMLSYSHVILDHRLVLVHAKTNYLWEALFQFFDTLRRPERQNSLQPGFVRLALCLIFVLPRLV